jgi:membrane fusion protein, multidrug efflux system
MVMKSRGFAALLAAAIAAAAAGCSGEAQTPAKAKAGAAGAQQGAVPITATVVEKKSVPIEIRVIGTVAPYSTVAVHAQVTGELTSVDFKEGDDVKKGQVLFTLDRRPLEAAVQQAQANLAKDQAGAVNADAQAARYRDLLQRGIATHEQVDQIISNAAAMKATVAADRAALDSAQVQLQYATITAPLSGRTGALMVHAGNLVRANDTTPLVVINQVTPIFVAFAIPEAQLTEFKRYLAAGTLHVEAQLPNAQGPGAEGKVTFVDNAVDPTTGTITIKGTFPNTDRRLWPGQFVNVVTRLTTEQNATVIPSAAVQSGPQGQYVFIVKPDHTADMRPVTVERTRGDESVIAKGVTPGETVVTDGQLRLVAGSHVTVKSDSKVVTP